MKRGSRRWWCWGWAGNTLALANAGIRQKLNTAIRRPPKYTRTYESCGRRDTARKFALADNKPMAGRGSPTGTTGKGNGRSASNKTERLGGILKGIAETEEARILTRNWTAEPLNPATLGAIMAAACAMSAVTMKHWAEVGRHEQECVLWIISDATSHCVCLRYILFKGHLSGLRGKGARIHVFDRTGNAG